MTDVYSNAVGNELCCFQGFDAVSVDVVAVAVTILLWSVDDIAMGPLV